FIGVGCETGFREEFDLKGQDQLGLRLALGQEAEEAGEQRMNGRDGGVRFGGLFNEMRGVSDLLEQERLAPQFRVHLPDNHLAQSMKRRTAAALKAQFAGVEKIKLPPEGRFRTARPACQRADSSK